MNQISFLDLKRVPTFRLLDTNSIAILPKWRDAGRQSLPDSSAGGETRRHAPLRRLERIDPSAMCSLLSGGLTPSSRRKDSNSSSRGSNLTLCSSLSLPLSSSSPKSSLLSLPVPVSPNRLQTHQPSSPRSRSSTLSFSTSTPSPRSSTRSSCSSRSNSRSPTISSTHPDTFHWTYAGLETELELDDAFEEDDVLIACPPGLASVASPRLRAALIYRHGGK